MPEAGSLSPESAEAGAAGFERHAAGFFRTLRVLGLNVPVGSTVSFLQAVGEVGIAVEDDVYWAGRATLVHRPEDIELFDQAFRMWWHRDPHVLDLRPVAAESVTLGVDDPDGIPPDGATGDDSGPVLSVRYSSTEVLAEKDFSLCTDEEMAVLHRLMDRLRFAGPYRRSRRLTPSKRSRGAPDLRRTVRAAIRSGGEPMERLYREPGQRPRRLVLLLDVSGSMEAYARGLIRFVHAAIVGRRRVEAFTLGTRLTRVTRELSSRDPDAALRAASGAVEDWSGGTRLGDGIQAFNDEWGARGMARGAVVVVLSDGWDRGEPHVMAEQMERLQRVAFRTVWVNPLKASPGYAPLAQGMAAALPFVDEFIEGHNYDSLEALAAAISA